jgi:hypothetical protein
VTHCPRCGCDRPAIPRQATVLRVGSTDLYVGARIASGDRFNLYHCDFTDAVQTWRGVAKVARDASSNPLLENELTVLQSLQHSDRADRLAPFLPGAFSSLLLSGEPTARRANVFRFDPAIQSPRSLYSLVDVRHTYPPGIDARDAAWMFRRLLTVLGFAHEAGFVHNAVLPQHVLIEPQQHGVVLFDWTSASAIGAAHAETPDWSRAWTTQPAGDPRNDIAMAARCMIFLIGGDVLKLRLLPGMESGVVRFVQRCAAGEFKSALKALDEFDQLITDLWGNRQFRVFTMPPKLPGA